MEEINIISFIFIENKKIIIENKKLRIIIDKFKIKYKKFKINNIIIIFDQIKIIIILIHLSFFTIFCIHMFIGNIPLFKKITIIIISLLIKNMLLFFILFIIEIIIKPLSSENKKIFKIISV